MEDETKPDVKAVKPSEGNAIAHISLRVQSQDGSTIQFKIKRNTPLKKLMQAFCDRKGIRLDSIRFVFDGTAISAENTPEQLDMEEDDCIEVFQSQTGGF